MIKTDCVYFPLDRPCKAHKATGLKCASCRKYRSFSKDGKGKILVIKLGAMGDVLRTTFILQGLKEKYPGSSITWVVAKGSESILEGNPNIARIWPLDLEIFKRLEFERFSLVINLDLSPESLSLADLAYADKKAGYWTERSRKIVSSNAAAEKWLSMSGSDDLKKKNRNTYQYWMSKILGLKRPDYEIFVPLTRESLAKAKKFSAKHGLRNKTVVGINPGAGKRWKMKKWTNSGYIRIINELAANNVKVLLFGGPQEKDLIRYLINKTGRKAVSTGIGNSINDFFALLDLCDAVLCCDTLALHASLGLKKKVVAVFGPTSAPEIEMYNRGAKIVAPVKCACCYLQDCDVRPNCMQSIPPSVVWDALRKLIKK